MRIAQIVPSLEDRHGGPSRSVRALASHLRAGGSEVSLLSTEEAPSVTGPRDALIFPRVFPQRLCRSPQLRAALLSSGCDVLHHHGLWLLTLDYSYRASRRLRVPLVISPRGMMSGWAWNHNRARKQLADWLVHPGALRGATGWHATSPEEASDIRALGFSQPICVAPNGVTLPEASATMAGTAHWLTRHPQLGQRRVALFYSRLHRKKRIKELLDIWATLRPANWTLLVVGIPEEYSIEILQAMADHAGVADSVIVADGRGQPPPYGVASLFVLPSHSENFGMVVGEALASSVPVLVTDSTPWRQAQESGAGWCVPWGDFASCLASALRLPAAELRRMGSQGRQMVQREFTWEAAAHRLTGFYALLKANHDVVSI